MGVCLNRFIGCILLFLWYGIAPAAPFAYITNFLGGSVSVIDIATNLVIATIQVDMLPQGVAVNPAGTIVYVANRGADFVSVIDVARNVVTATATGCRRAS